ncbi:exportin-2-like [Macadamia integrifolia]|uniref:exportin-2-like n=1 Tax=Macadamia integrifolia TaxID=60698 RepID=UPI001C52B9BD|nr:exportin-2-like [Macadamia integrifolia]
MRIRGNDVIDEAATQLSFILDVLNLAVDTSVGESIQAAATNLFLDHVQTSTLSTNIYNTWFADRLQKIIDFIIIPNIILRDEDIIFFERNYIEFIRFWDMEGSEVDSRRRDACGLLKGAILNFMKPVTGMIMDKIDRILGIIFPQNLVADWKFREYALFLLGFLTSQLGGYIDKYFGPFISELYEDINSFPILRAGALRCFVVFRHKLPKLVVTSSVPLLLRFLDSESIVVRSCVADCFEKLLLMKKEVGEKLEDDKEQNRFYEPLSLHESLFHALKLPESDDNLYIMKCIMRSLQVSSPTNASCDIDAYELGSILRDLSNEPKNPNFITYLFQGFFQHLLFSETWQRSPVTLWLLKAGFQKKHKELLEADWLEKLIEMLVLLSTLDDRGGYGLCILILNLKYHHIQYLVFNSMDAASGSENSEFVVEVTKPLMKRPLSLAVDTSVRESIQAVVANLFLDHVQTPMLSTSIYNAWFAERLQKIIDFIIIPNIILRDEDIIFSERNYIEFIGFRDMEGSDVDSRRRDACELPFSILRSRSLA